MDNKSKPFKNQHLEVIRGIAAFLVVIDHLINRVPEVMQYKNHYINLIGNWSAEAVIIFFILSGIVIHSSVENRPRSGFNFFVERLIRIHPILIISVIFSVVIEIYLFKSKPSTIVIVGNIIPVSTLQGYLVTMLWNSNPVIWSLSCELFFYAVFSIFAIRKNGLNYSFMAVWFVLGIISFIIYYNPIPNNLFVNYLAIMLAYSPIWIVGFFIWSIRKKLNTSLILATLSLCCLPIISRAHITHNHFDPIKNLIFSIASIPLFLFLIRENNGDRSHFSLIKKFSCILIICMTYSIGFLYLINDPTYPIVSKVLYICLPFSFLFFYIKPFKTLTVTIYYSLILKTFKHLGSLSYSIYLIHNILIVVIFNLFSFNLGLKLLLLCFSVYIFSYLLERKLQPALNQFLKPKLLR
ncbi:acyltransferase family protein [Pedobacter fastidiosus]|uniref:Acyltransferase n=1 Tax=Pedobacter fastidiosus TaxID=2765361 RepID=A0ABR7KVL8_9SPHI|nr:acyltransferase [Pedobacter fastidiosus]MBC6112154.1 acyltransferase [Pedobacter fastidiosus]